MVQTPIYLDNNSTTRVDPRVLDAMLPYFCDIYGNAASKTHAFGRAAEQAVEAAREQIAQLIGSTPREIIFTSGATESDNLAIKGVASMHRRKGNHIITAQTEHKAVLDACKRLQREGFDLTYLPVDRFGLITPDQVKEAITDSTILVSIMAANNEIGTIQPIAEIGTVCKDAGVLFHCDAAQATGKIHFDVEAMQVDLASFSAHKVYGPKGIGCLYARRRNPHVRIDPLIDGGGHERGMRSGTLPVQNIVGFGKACEIAQQQMDSESQRLTQLRDRLHQQLTDMLDDVTLNGHPTQRLPQTLNLSFDFVQGEALMMSMRDVAVSSGSACTSASVEPSYVLRALGLCDDLAHSSIRFGLGRFTTEQEIDFAAARVRDSVLHLRAINPVYQMEQQTTVTS